MVLEFIDESELLGLADVSALERLLDDGVVVVSLVLGEGLVLGAVPVPELVSAPGRALVLGPVAGLVVLMPGLVLELLGVLVLSLVLGAADVDGWLVVDDVELELSVVDCAYTYPAITASAAPLPMIRDRNRLFIDDSCRSEWKPSRPFPTLGAQISAIAMPIAVAQQARRRGGVFAPAS